jgi:hypothetical protein
MFTTLALNGVMIMSRIRHHLVVSTLLVAAGTAVSLPNAEAGPRKPHGAWVAGDFHQHTFYTDGATPFDFVMEKNYEYGLDWWFNSEHGGGRITDGNGDYWDDTTVYPGNPILGDVAMSGDHQVMWRWQSLADFAFPDILATRATYPDRRIGSGLEWNVPGHEHCSTGIVADDAEAISAFEFMFDAADNDTSREGEATPYGTLTKQNGARYDDANVKTALSREEAHLDAIAACAWMQKQRRRHKINDGYIVFAHIERKGDFSTGGYNIEHFRDFNNAGPDVCFGFEGTPGHQANGSRGGFGSGAFGGTYGGAGFYTAQLGGLWDALLGEGRRWFNFASSDYHEHYTAGGDDFYPGEYQKDYVYAVDANHDGQISLKEIIEGLRSGKSFYVEGDLINHLDFSVTTLSGRAEMGEELRIRSHRGLPRLFRRNPALVTIEFKSPAANNNGDKPVVNHIDLIAGDITGRVSPDSTEYTKATNESARVVARFTSDNWKVKRDGTIVVRYMVPDLATSTYFRLRGSNIAVGTPFEQDENGNPLADSLATDNLGLDGAAEAWADLWFYSNPIFVYVD